MEKTPFPGYWLSTHHCWLQEAEFKLQLNRRHYHECGKILDDKLIVYPEETAQKIIAYLQAQRHYAEYHLLKNI
jgi:predicted metal-dependent hydrolase